jgi:MATE family multidrug resistance protein
VKLNQYIPVYRKNLALAIPVIFSQIGQVTVNVFDNIMVGHLGTTELAAASFSLNIFLIGMLAGMGITMGLTPLVGHSINSNSRENTSCWFRNGLLVNFVTSLFLVTAMASVVLFMSHFGQPREVVEKAVPFYLLHVASLIPMMLFFSFKQFFEGLGNTKIAMVITIIINIINIILNYGLIWGKLGLPELGLYGSGVATLIARTLMPILFFTVMLNKPGLKGYLIDAFRSKFEIQRIKQLLSIGMSIGGQMVIEVLAFSMGAIMMGWISKESLAGHQVAMSLASMTYMISVGLASGTTIRVSHAFGENNIPEVKRIIYASIHLVIAFMTTMGLSFVLLRNYLPLLYTSDLSVVKIASSLLVVASFFQIFDGMQVVLLGSLRGIADVKLPMIFAFFSYVIVSLPVSYLVAFVLKAGNTGIWVGFVFGLSTAAVLFALRLKYRIRLEYLKISSSTVS